MGGGNGRGRFVIYNKKKRFLCLGLLLLLRAEVGDDCVLIIIVDVVNVNFGGD